MTANYPRAYLYMRIVQSKLFIDKCFADGINLNDITNQAFFSTYHFIRTFKSIYGLTPHQYLRQVRIEKAKQYLKEGKSINTVCKLVGFESSSSFMGLFKRTNNQTPSEYKQQYLKRKEQEQTNPFQFVPSCFSGQFQ